MEHPNDGSERKMTRNQKRKNDMMSNVNLNLAINFWIIFISIYFKNLINDLDPNTAILEKEHEEVTFNIIFQKLFSTFLMNILIKRSQKSNILTKFNLENMKLTHGILAPFQMSK